MRTDVLALIKQFKVKTFGNKGNIEKLEAEILPNEQLFYIAPTNATIIDKQTDAKANIPGVMFISNRRVLFRSFLTKAKEEFVLSEIHSISTEGNGISGGHLSFSSAAKRVDFLVSYKADIIAQVEEALIQAIMNADFTPIPTMTDPIPAPVEGRVPYVVKCEGCGATNIVMQGTVGRCEYCRRYIQ